MDWLLVAVLAVIQGLTEFLPISSSGHLTVAEGLHQAVTDRDVPDLLGLNIVLHAGTLLAIVIFYWHRIWRLLGQDRRVIGLLIVGTLPAVVLGLPLHEWGPELLTDSLLAGCMLPLTGAILIFASRCLPGEIAYQDIGYRRALLIGLAQALAILPGISRSGSTIAAGLALGLRRDAAATFSFLLAIPAIGGACVLELRDLLTPSAGDLPPLMLLSGALLSMLVGLLALWWVLRWLERGRLQYFAYWCIPLGVAVIAWQLAARFSL